MTVCKRSHLISTLIAAEIFQLGLENRFARAKVVIFTGQTHNLYKFLRCRNMIYEKICSVFGFFSEVLRMEKDEVTFQLVH